MMFIVFSCNLYIYTNHSIARFLILSILFLKNIENSPKFSGIQTVEKVKQKCLAQVTNWVRLKFAAMNLKKYAIHSWRKRIFSSFFAVIERNFCAKE